EHGGMPTSCAEAVAGKAQVQLKLTPGDLRNKLKWKWLGAAAFDVAALGDPTTSDDLLLCTIDQTGFIWEAIIPAGGACGSDPCWSAKPGKIKYVDKAGSLDGVTKMQGASGAA